MKQGMGWVVMVSMSMGMACGADPKTDEVLVEEQEHGGARLKLRWVDFAGTRVRDGFLDRQRGEECVAMQWADGATYCTPDPNRYEHELVYQDAACEIPLGKRFHLSPICPPPQTAYFLFEEEVEGCGKKPSRLYPGTLAPYQQTYERLGDGACRALDLGGYSVLYELGPEIPRSELVAITPLPRTDKGRLQPQYGETADGAHIVLSTEDRELDGTCQLVRSPDAQSLSCLASASTTIYFSDATCAAPVTTVYPAHQDPQLTCRLPKYSAISDLTCAASWTLHRTGEPFDGPLYAGDYGCVRLEQRPGGTFYKTEGSFPAQRLMRELPEVTSARIVPVSYAGGGLRKQTGLLHDTQLGMDCTPQRTIDGMIRCMPVPWLIFSWAYTDRDCLNRVNLLLHDKCLARPSPFVYDDLPACGASFQAYPVGERYTGPLYQIAFGECQLRRDDGFDYYRLGDPVPLENFAPATAVTEP